jgi:hypothetical protein
MSLYSKGNKLILWFLWFRWSQVISSDFKLISRFEISLFPPCVLLLNKKILCHKMLLNGELWLEISVITEYNIIIEFLFILFIQRCSFYFNDDWYWSPIDMNIWDFLSTNSCLDFSYFCLLLFRANIWKSLKTIVIYSLVKNIFPLLFECTKFSLSTILLQ